MDIHSLLQYHSSLHLPQNTTSRAASRHVQHRFCTSPSSEEKIGIWHSGVEERRAVPGLRVVVGVEMLCRGAGAPLSTRHGSVVGGSIAVVGNGTWLVDSWTAIGILEAESKRHPKLRKPPPII
jgi:hypothetical protein